MKQILSIIVLSLAVIGCKAKAESSAEEAEMLVEQQIDQEEELVHRYEKLTPSERASYNEPSPVELGQ